MTTLEVMVGVWWLLGMAAVTRNTMRNRPWERHNLGWLSVVYAAIALTPITLVFGPALFYPPRMSRDRDEA